MRSIVTFLRAALHRLGCRHCADMIEDAHAQLRLSHGRVGALRRELAEERRKTLFLSARLGDMETMAEQARFEMERARQVSGLLFGAMETERARQQDGGAE